MTWAAGLTIAVSVLLAVLGYIATYTYNLKLAQRKDRLERVNKQLAEFYGPLLALSGAAQSAWEAFRQRHRPDTRSYWSNDPPPSEEEAAAWRLWMTEVFMPLNLDMVELIHKHADLLDTADMPQGLLDACAHVASYRPVMKQWEMGDYSEHTATINFPSDQVSFIAREGFNKLKAEQSVLLGGTRAPGPPGPTG